MTAVCAESGGERRKRCSHAEDAANQAVRKTFAILGVDIESPQEVSQFQDSLRFSDKLRRNVDKGMLPMFLLIASLIGAAFIAGLNYNR